MESSVRSKFYAMSHASLGSLCVDFSSRDILFGGFFPLISVQSRSRYAVRPLNIHFDSRRLDELTFYYYNKNWNFICINDNSFFAPVLWLRYYHMGAASWIYAKTSQIYFKYFLSRVVIFRILVCIFRFAVTCLEEFLQSADNHVDKFVNRTILMNLIFA